MNVNMIKADVQRIMKLKEDIKERYEFHEACSLFVLDCKRIASFDEDDDIGKHWTIQRIHQIAEHVINGAENKARKDLYVNENEEHYYETVAKRIIDEISQPYVIISEFPWHNGHTYSEVSAIVNGVFEVGEYLSKNSYSEQKDLVIKPRCVGENWVSGIKR